MKKYLLLITVALIVAPLVTAGCTSPTSPSPSPSTAASTATSSATVTASTAVASPSAAASASPTATPTASPSASQLSYTVTIPNTAAPYSFQPASMTVPRGASVTWRNDATVPHQIVSNTGAFSSAILSPGQTYTHQFTQAGTYAYHCGIHTYMMGTITVQ